MQTNSQTRSTLTFREGEGFTLGHVLVRVEAIEQGFIFLRISGDRVGTRYRAGIGRVLPIDGGSVEMTAIAKRGNKRVDLEIQHGWENRPRLARKEFVPQRIAKPRAGEGIV